ncbi:MAG: YcxB family protein [Ferruginibacter sp.]
MITVQYAITKEDYLNYYAYVTWDAPENRKKKINYYIRQSIPLVLFIVAFYYTGIFERNNKFILLIAGFLVLTSVLSFFSVRSNSIKRARKIVDDPNNSSIFLDKSMIISESGISVKDPLIDVKFQWNAFTKKQENAGYYFLFINTLQALIIPKRIFKNEDERLQFEKLLSQFLSFDAEIGHLMKS